MDVCSELNHAGALQRLNEGLQLALEQADDDPATLAWLIGATLVSLGPGLPGCGSDREGCGAAGSVCTQIRGRIGPIRWIRIRRLGSPHT